MFKTTRPHDHRRGGKNWNHTPTPQHRERFLLFIVVGAIWRWRWELITVLAIVGIYDRLANAGYSTLVIVILLVAALTAVLAFAPTRRFARNRFWCVMDRHRLRVCMSELRTYNYSGRAAFILAARSTREGEAVWLWLRPGLSVDNLEQRTEAIAAACWARDARVRRSPKMAALVRVDIQRRDPLARAHIESPLLATTRHLPAGEVNPTRALHLIRAGSTDVTTKDTVTPIHAPAATSASAASSAKQTSKEPKPSARSVGTPAAAVAPVISRNGEDVSDYV